MTSPRPLWRDESLRRNAVIVATAESAILQWAEQAGTPEFEQILPNMN